MSLEIVVFYASAPHSAPLPLPIKQVETETYRERLETEIDENTVRGKERRREKFTKFTKYLGARMKNNVSLARMKNVKCTMPYTTLVHIKRPSHALVEKNTVCNTG